MSSNKNCVLAKAAVDYSEDLKLNVTCDDGDDGHNAVVHCSDCMANFCKNCSDTMHAFNIFSKHVVVRLSKRKPISCHIHPQETAHLICTEPYCKGSNRPICLFCQQFDAHKGHQYELLEKKYTEVEALIRNSLKKVDKKRTNCVEQVNELERRILAFSAGNRYKESDLEMINKLFSNSKEPAFKTVEDYQKNRVKTWKALRIQYENDKNRLDNISSLLRNFEKLGKTEKLENWKNVETLAMQAEKTINSLTNFEFAKCDNLKMTLPITESKNIKVKTMQAGSSETDYSKQLELLNATCQRILNSEADLSKELELLKSTYQPTSSSEIELFKMLELFKLPDQPIAISEADLSEELELLKLQCQPIASSEIDLSEKQHFLKYPCKPVIEISLSEYNELIGRPNHPTISSETDLSKKPELLKSTCKPTGIPTISSSDYNELIGRSTYPIISSETDLSKKHIKSPHKRKTLAVYCLDSSNSLFSQFQSYYFSSRKLVVKENGWLHTYEDGRTIISLKEQPNLMTVDVIKHQYIAVLRLWVKDGKHAFDLLKNEMRNKYYRKIIAEVMDSSDSEKLSEFAEELRRIAETDERVIVTSNRLRKPMDSQFFNDFDCFL